MPAQLAQEGVRLGEVLAVRALALVEVRHGVEPQAVEVVVAQPSDGVVAEEAADLVDSAPGLVMCQVTSERAGKAKQLLESLGATVTVSGDPGQA